MAVLNDELSPFNKWFQGGATNSALNEIDSHVLSCCGECVAIIDHNEASHPNACSY